MKIVPWPKPDDDASTSESDSSPERFILCRSRERSKKEEGITQRFEKKIEAALTRMKARCEKQARDPMPGSLFRFASVEREIGRMLGKNSRAAKLFDVKVTKTDKDEARIEWSKVEATRDWTTLSAGSPTNPAGKTWPQTALENNPKENAVETFDQKPTKTLSFFIELGKSG